jgi:hypothetical protein
MRDILFKAKRADNGEWVEGYIVKYGFAGKEKWYIVPSYASDLYAFEIIPNTICQYTGLKDKAKNKVFENSIIIVISENVFGVIKYGEYRSPFDSSETKHIGFYVEWKNEKRCNLWRKDLGYWLNDTTIICGNIFDNAEVWCE